MNDKHSKVSFFAPSYYSRFRCIADRCRHSCCVDWEICIDDATLEVYRRDPTVMATVTECEDGACFALCADGRCPHLDEQGLCRLILDHGEDYLSDICRRHPRFFNDMGDGWIEVGLGLVCEEACRLILMAEEPFTLVPIDDFQDEAEDFSNGDDGSSDFRPLPARDRILRLIEATAGGFDAVLAAVKTAFDIADLHTPDEWIGRYLSLEILDPAWAETLRSARGQGSRPDMREFDPHYARLLSYFVYRHVGIASSPENLRARLAFACLSADTVRRLHRADATPTLEGLLDLARRYSAEIEYSEDNTDELIFAFECGL